MVVNYFYGIQYEPSSFDGNFYILTHHKSTWYCCAYKDRNRCKNAIINVTNSIAIQKTTDLDWEFHHVVERNNLADIPLEAMGLGTLDYFYNELIPTIMIHKKEHRERFTNTFKIPEVRELYRTPNGSTARKMEDREAENNRLYTSGKLTLADVKSTVAEMAARYEEAYERHYLLQKLSRNFFTDLTKKIDKI